MRTAPTHDRQTPTFSMTLRREMEEFKVPFITFTTTCQSLTTKRKDLAPQFMKLFRHYRRETHGTFVSFVHDLDPLMPTDRKAYQNHRAYQAALYLRRLIDAPKTTPQHRRTASPFTALAMTMRSLLYFTKKHEVEVWSALKRSTHWDDRQIKTLQAKMRKVHPLSLPGAPRLVKRAHG